MNRIAAVPNWSFFDPDLAHRAASDLSHSGVVVHYCKGDVDHQRTVTAYSGDESHVLSATTKLAHLILPQVNLGIHQGVHPRIGALDVLPFVLLDGSEAQLIDSCRIWAERFSHEFEIPVHLYEKAAHPGHECRLPYLRGQMGSMFEPLPTNRPVHSQWGTSIVGVRDFLLATNLNIDSPNLSFVKRVAQGIRDERDGGDARLRGVRALGFELKSRGITQLSLNFTQPDVTKFDEVYDICVEMLAEFDAKVLETELIGIIRARDAKTATRLTYEPSQLLV